MPLRPVDMPAAKAAAIPDGVVEIFDALITKDWNGHRSMVMQEDAIQGIIAKFGVSRQEVFDNKWLDVEDLYRLAGWNVEYDKPAYSECYPARFVFKPA